MIKGPVQQEHIILVNIYATNVGVPKYIKQILTDIKGEINNKMIKIEDIHTLLISMDNLSRQKIFKETSGLM